MQDIHLTIVGNVTKTPEVAFTKKGAAVMRITVASTPQYYSKADQKYVDGETTFMPCELRSAGSEKHNLFIERQAEYFEKGDRVIVTGKLTTRSRKDGDDEVRWNVLMVDEIGFSTKFTRVTPE